MITDEQVIKALDVYYGIEHVGGARESLIEGMRKALEAYEANKPKPEPVGYIYPSSYEKALRNKSSCKMFVVPVTNLDTGDESSVHLYTTPPTREPLSDYEMPVCRMMINGVLLSPDCTTAFIHGVRFAEQKHGIGEKQ